MMYLALSYDHRIIDGKEAVSFLVHLKNEIEIEVSKAKGKKCERCWKILENQWDGDNPKDNIIFGSDLNFSTKNKRLKIKSSVAMSFINENIWNPVKSVNEFDTYSDYYSDCEFGAEVRFISQFYASHNPYLNDYPASDGVGRGKGNPTGIQTTEILWEFLNQHSKDVVNQS